MYSILLFIFTVIPPENGTVIVFEDGFLSRPIERRTGSSMSHSAIILYNDGVPYVYESTWPKVQKTEYYEYLKYIEERKHKRKQLKVHTISPQYEYTIPQINRMFDYAESQLGRSFSMKGYKREKEVKGIHCAQYIGNILEQSGRVRSLGIKEIPYTIYLKAVSM